MFCTAASGEPEPHAAADCYRPTRPNGKRVPGWDDVNITRLASDMGISYRFLLGVLTGQRNSTLSLLQRAAQFLDMPVTQLIERMDRAARLKAIEAEQAPDKAERRRQRNEQRALKQPH